MPWCLGGKSSDRGKESASSNTEVHEERQHAEGHERPVTGGVAGTRLEFRISDTLSHGEQYIVGAPERKSQSRYSRGGARGERGIFTPPPAQAARPRMIRGGPASRMRLYDRMPCLDMHSQ